MDFKKKKHLYLTFLHNNTVERISKALDRQRKVLNLLSNRVVFYSMSTEDISAFRGYGILNTDVWKFNSKKP